MILNELENKLEELYKQAVNLHEEFEGKPEFQTLEFSPLALKLRGVWEQISDALWEVRRLEVEE